MKFAGPGLLVSVGYMGPGNRATDIAAGSQYGYDLLFVVLLSGLAAIVLQGLSPRLGILTGKDLASAAREGYGSVAGRIMWLLAEVAIIACDVAEVQPSFRMSRAASSHPCRCWAMSALSRREATHPFHWP